jgi:hypothetical protein
MEDTSAERREPVAARSLEAVTVALEELSAQTPVREALEVLLEVGSAKAHHERVWGALEGARWEALEALRDEVLARATWDLRSAFLEKLNDENSPSAGEGLKDQRVLVRTSRPVRGGCLARAPRDAWAWELLELDEDLTLLPVLLALKAAVEVEEVVEVTGVSEAELETTCALVRAGADLVMALEAALALEEES